MCRCGSLRAPKCAEVRSFMCGDAPALRMNFEPFPNFHEKMLTYKVILPKTDFLFYGV